MDFINSILPFAEKLNPYELMILFGLAFSLYQNKQIKHIVSNGLSHKVELIKETVVKLETTVNLLECIKKGDCKVNE
jgi:hypothetical protein